MLRSNKSKFRPPLILTQPGSNQSTPEIGNQVLTKTWPLSNKTSKTHNKFQHNELGEFKDASKTKGAKKNGNISKAQQTIPSKNKTCTETLVDSTTDICKKSILSNSQKVLMNDENSSPCNTTASSSHRSNKMTRSQNSNENVKTNSHNSDENTTFLRPFSQHDSTKKTYKLDVDSSSESEISMNSSRVFQIKSPTLIQDSTMSSSQSKDKNKYVENSESQTESQFTTDTEMSTSTSSGKKKRKLTRLERFSQVMDPPLSQPDDNLNKMERMKWYQKRRNVGVWVHCDACDKIRFLKDTRDPLDLADKWYCRDNPDANMNRCEIPQQGPSPFEVLDFIENVYNAGSIVWGRLKGYPWWPAMVDDDPDVEQYYWIEEHSDVPTHYHVTFFDSDAVSRCWLTPDEIKPFKNHSPKMLAKFKMYSRRLIAARQQAQCALEMPLIERLEKYSFLARWIEDPSLYVGAHAGAAAKNTAKKPKRKPDKKVTRMESPELF